MPTPAAQRRYAAAERSYRHLHADLVARAPATLRDKELAGARAEGCGDARPSARRRPAAAA